MAEPTYFEFFAGGDPKAVLWFRDRLLAWTAEWNEEQRAKGEPTLSDWGADPPQHWQECPYCRDDVPHPPEAL